MMFDEWEIEEDDKCSKQQQQQLEHDVGGSPPAIDELTAKRGGSKFGNEQINGARFFSETEKIEQKLEEEKNLVAAAVVDDESGVERVEELCSVLWNQIKDATVLDAHELSNSLIAHLHVQTERLARQIHVLSAHPQQNTAIAQLRLATVRSALIQLKEKKVDTIEQARKPWKHGGNRNCAAADESGADQFALAGMMARRKWAWLCQVRKWLNQQEMQQTRIRQRIPYSKNSMESLMELELEQKALQEQIQTEGRAKHQQLCSAQQEHKQQQQQQKDLFDNGRREEQRRVCETLEHRYLALWLASLENLELITHFKDELAKKHILQCLLLNTGELGEDDEYGPRRKRRKTTNNQEVRLPNEQNDNDENAQMVDGGIEQQRETTDENDCRMLLKQQPPATTTTLLTPKMSLTTSTITTTTTGSNAAIITEQQNNGIHEQPEQQQHQLFASDIGYSSGENMSIHDECCCHHEAATATNDDAEGGGGKSRVMNQMPNECAVNANEGNGKGEDGAQQECWAEQIAHSSELEKSFYRTVPLDEFGMTDNEECCWPPRSGTYLAHKLLYATEDGQQTTLQQQLTDSLIVHVDNTPDENRHLLHDFEEVMDLLDEQQQLDNDNGTLVKPPINDCDCVDDDSSLNNNITEQRDNNGTQRSSQKQPIINRKRTAAIETKKFATELAATATGTPQTSRKKHNNGAGRRKLAMARRSRTLAGNGWWSNSNSSNSNYVSSDFEWDEDFGKPVVNNNKMKGADADDVELPELLDADEKPLLFARKKALTAFRDGLRKAAADSGMVSTRLQELLALLDRSLGDVHSVAFLLRELDATFHSLSRLCMSLESKMLKGRKSDGRNMLCGGGNEGMEEQGKQNQATAMKGIDRQHNNNSNTQFQEDIHAELVLCHERMNALETTCNNFALLLGTHLAHGTCTDGAVATAITTPANCNAEDGDDDDLLAQFAMECNRIKEELQKLKSRFNEKFVFCSVKFTPDHIACLTAAVPSSDHAAKVDCYAQTVAADQCRGVPVAVAVVPPRQAAETSFWRSYLLLCLIGFIVSFATLMYASNREGTDWRWTIGPQLHYRNGPPPV